MLRHAVDNLPFVLYRSLEFCGRENRMKAALSTNTETLTVKSMSNNKNKGVKLMRVQLQKAVLRQAAHQDREVKHIPRF